MICDCDHRISCSVCKSWLFLEMTLRTLVKMPLKWHNVSKIGPSNTGDPLHSRALAHSRAPLSTQPCPHCSHSRAPGEQWARLCVFTLQGCVQAARLCRGSPVSKVVKISTFWTRDDEIRNFSGPYILWTIRLKLWGGIIFDFGVGYCAFATLKTLIYTLKSLP